MRYLVAKIWTQSHRLIFDHKINQNIACERQENMRGIQAELAKSLR